MNILIIGASTKTSIGYSVGEFLRENGHCVQYASRGGKLGLRCDVTQAKSIVAAIKKTKPDVVILGAGLFLRANRIGSLRDVEKIKAHLLAKSFGALMLADALVAQKNAAMLVVLAGRDISGNPGFSPYSIGNGALWNLVRFVNKHTRFRAFYIDLPFVEGSTMQKQFSKAIRRAKQKGSIATDKVIRAVAKIVRGSEKRERIVLGKGTT